VRTEAIRAAVLVVDACPETEELLAGGALGDADFTLENVEDAQQAIARIEDGGAVDVVLLAPRLPDPVRIAQRLHSLDRDAGVVILATPEREPEVRHALEVAPFLEGDVVCTSTADADGLGPTIHRAARRPRARRAEAVDRQRPRDTPPPLSARYLGTLLDSAPIGIVTLDATGAVIGWNRRTGAMLGTPEVEALGSAFADLWPPLQRARLRKLIDSLESTGMGSVRQTFERGERAFDITGARFGTRDGDSGAILALQDVTERVAAERQLRQTARILQESLLPPHLPPVPGVEMAALFRPAGAGLQVGGDFYDIFELREGEWGLVIGDVCGKGADAAALTALTRYTVRTAAMYEDSPGAALRVLNEALLRQRSDFRFTTLAYCVLGTGSSPVSMRSATGGHPRPLLLRADGTAEAFGAGGPLLGVVPETRFPDTELELNAGDAVVLYTDGLCDAQAPLRSLGEEELLAELRACAGMSAAQITARLEELAVGGSTGPARDDIAVVVARLEG
jgi:PAS domain S-box-containing protein